eukprot:TRINITY_DN8100_c0_g1_i1.p1 TRINITY_DN8100_c0_g1~~TRINITY_DN8100_c0_g1_i1.p1  ORF type:complete len:432 (-),score=50.13 TRINITY_DN8100_c0_g1_i1:61-1314(-)
MADKLGEYSFADSQYHSDCSDLDEPVIVADGRGSINDPFSAPKSSCTKSPCKIPPAIVAFFKPDNAKLFVFLVLLVAFATVDTVTFKLFTNRVANFIYFFHQVFLLIILLVFTVITLIRIYLTKHIDGEIRAFPKWKFLVMGLLDLFATLMMMFGSTNTAGPLQVLLRQSVLVFVMIVSIVALKRRFRIWHYLAAAIIVGGVALTVVSDFLRPDAQNRTVWWGALLFGGAGIPIALSTCYKEHAFASARMDLYYLNAWVAFFQFLGGMVALPLAMPLQGLPIQSLPENFEAAILCWFKGQGTGSDCSGNMIVVVFYIGVATVYNVFILLVIQHGSAALMWVATALSVPLANFAFMLPFLVGSSAIAFDWFNLGGVVLVFGGLILFNRVAMPDDQAVELAVDMDAISADMTEREKLLP